MAAWAEAKAADGRTYYWNKETKETRWEKPDDFDAAPAHDPAADDAGWSEATAPDGRKYYYNRVTRETAWQAPEAFLRNQPQAAAIPGPANAPAFVAGGGALTVHGDDSDNFRDRRGGGRRDDRYRDNGLPQKPNFDRGWDSRQDAGGFRGPMPVKIDEPEYATEEEAEEAFFNLMRKHNITPDMTFRDMLRKCVKERDYRAFKDPRLRKMAFERYCLKVAEEQKAKEQELAEQRREDFRQMLTEHPDVVHYDCQWIDVKPVIEKEAAYKNIGNDEECKSLCKEYVKVLYFTQVGKELIEREEAVEEINGLLGQLVLTNDVRYTEFLDMLQKNERYTTEEKFESLDDLDILDCFKARIFELDRIANEKKQHEKKMKYRRERKARDAFKELLAELRSQGKIRAGTWWKTIYPLLENDDRYKNMLGNPGSNPLELFWDVVAEEEIKLRSKRNVVLDLLEERRYEMTLNTPLTEFVDVVRSDPKTAAFSQDDHELIYKRLMEKIKQRAEEDRSERPDRSIRRTVDGLRSAIKHLDPPVRLGDTYEDIEPRLVDLEEYRILDDADRHRAWDKHIARLREKEEDRDRDRDRSRRHHGDDHRSDSRRHRSRSREVDAYEADRRKAQADRERHYHKASFGISPPRERDSHRRDYEHSYDRRDHERSYLSRADPRDKGRSLDYGDDDTAGSVPSRSGSVRKRRDSEASSVSRREQKRPRHAPESESTIAKQQEQRQEEVALQSGSEEGEIEEV